MVSYSYSVLRYSHDASVGEQINVGVLIYAPGAGYVRFLSEHRTRVLSQLFRGFNREEFQRFLGWLEVAVENLQGSMALENLRLFNIENAPEDAGALAKKLVPDNDLSFHFGPVGAGVTGDLNSAAQAVFERMVVSQRPAKREHVRRDDEAVWSVFHTAFRTQGITRALKPVIISTPDFEIPFKHAFKNEKLHAVEPQSFDYANVEGIRLQAALWAGNAIALSESKDFSQLYLLLGAPQLQERHAEFVRAKNFLHRLPSKPRIYEEHEAQECAEELADYMRRHNVLDDEGKREPIE